MTATKSRRIELDYAKGFAILFLILSHSGTGEKLGTWIFSFHMPIFFVICGMLQAMKHSDGIPFKNFGSFLVRRSRQLVVPYLVFGLALTFFYGSLNLVSGGS